MKVKYLKLKFILIFVLVMDSLKNEKEDLEYLIGIELVKKLHYF
jgi:hypothetical protein